MRILFRTIIPGRMVVLSVMLVLFTFLKMAALKGALSLVYPQDDTTVYMTMGASPLLSKAFLAGVRPPVVPLVYKIFGNDKERIVLFQTFLSACCWSWLALALMGSMRQRLSGWVVCTLMLLTGLTYPIVIWDGSLMSESISISLLVAFVGCIVRYSGCGTSFTAVCTTITGFVWIFTKETNAWMALCVAAVAGVAGLTRKRRAYLLMALMGIAGFVMNDVSSNVGNRWVFPFLNVFSQRILTDENKTEEFAEMGMPLSGELLAMKGKWAGSDNYAYFNSPGLDEFRTWLYRRGKSTYMRWLLHHPVAAVREPLDNIEVLMASNIDHWYGLPGMKRFLSSRMSNCLFIIGNEGYFSIPTIWFLVFGAGFVIGAGLWRKNRLWGLMVVMILFAFPHIFLVWHGDAMEVPRHAMMVRVQLNITWWTGICLLMDGMPFSLIKRCLRGGGFISRIVTQVLRLHESWNREK